MGESGKIILFGSILAVSAIFLINTAFVTVYSCSLRGLPYPNNFQFALLV